MSTFVSFADFALVLYYHPLLATLLAAFVKKAKYLRGTTLTFHNTFFV